MSFAMTERQLLDGSKTVTRRVGWHKLKPGDELTAVRKSMGLRRGEKQQVLGRIRVKSVRSERLDAITAEDCAREGFPELSPAEFIALFCKGSECKPWRNVRRIEFEIVHLEGVP